MKTRLALATIGALVSLSASANAAVTDATAARRGANWLSSQQITGVGQQADTIVAMAATGIAKSTLRARLVALTSAAPAYATGPGLEKHHDGDLDRRRREPAKRWRSQLHRADPRGVPQRFLRHVDL